MKSTLAVTLAAALIFSAGCKIQHPSEIKMEPDFDPGTVGTVLIIPAVSSIVQGEDPNRESERITNRIIFELASERFDYTFLSPEQYRLAVSRAKLATRQEEFDRKWITEHVAHDEFLQAVNSMNVDMLLIPLVYLWNKDEADYREMATASATQVGITLSLVDPRSGRIMWEATDENYQESVRTEGDRVQASSGGIDRRVSGVSSSGKDVYAAPPFEDVTRLVLEALMNAIPEKTPSGR